MQTTANQGDSAIPGYAEGAWPTDVATRGDTPIEYSIPRAPFGRLWKRAGMKRALLAFVVRRLLRQFFTGLGCRVARQTAMFVLPLGICGCATSAGVHIYGGPERPLQEIAVVIVDMDQSRTETAGPRITAIDGQRVTSRSVEYHLLPGEHTIHLTYRITFAQQPVYSRRQVEDLENARIVYPTASGAVKNLMDLLSTHTALARSTVKPHGTTTGDFIITRRILIKGLLAPLEAPFNRDARKTGDVVATESIETGQPVTLRVDLTKGYVYRVFARPVPCDPNDWLSPPTPALGGGVFDGPFEMTPLPKAFIHRGLVLLGTVEEVACAPELLPYYRGLTGQATGYGAAYGGLFGAWMGYNSSPVPKTARAWKRIADAHCPDEPK